MHFSLVKCNPPDTPPSHGFDDAMFPLYYGLRSLGYATEILCNAFNPSSRNIVFGSCIAPRRIGRAMPRGSIIFNLEQILEGSKWCNRDYLAHLRDFEVWDYSATNARLLSGRGIRCVHVPLGYVPEMTRLAPDFPEGADALFYGLLTERRDAVIRGLVQAGRAVLASQEAFGDLRDRLLAHARVVLNIHQFVPARLETVRLGYVFANRRPVLSEYDPDDEIPEHLAEACYFVPYAELPEGLNRLLADGPFRKKLGEQGFSAYRSRPMAGSLAGVVGKRPMGMGRPGASFPGPVLDRPYLARPCHEWRIAPPPALSSGTPP